MKGWRDALVHSRSQLGQITQGARAFVGSRTFLPPEAMLEGLCSGSIRCRVLSVHRVRARRGIRRRRRKTSSSSSSLALISPAPSASPMTLFPRAFSIGSFFPSLLSRKTRGRRRFLSQALTFNTSGMTGVHPACWLSPFRRRSCGWSSCHSTVRLLPPLVRTRFIWAACASTAAAAHFASTAPAAETRRERIHVGKAARGRRHASRWRWR